MPSTDQRKRMRWLRDGVGGVVVGGTPPGVQPAAPRRRQGGGGGHGDGSPGDASAAASVGLDAVSCIVAEAQSRRESLDGGSGGGSGSVGFGPHDAPMRGIAGHVNSYLAAGRRHAGRGGGGEPSDGAERRSTDQDVDVDEAVREGSGDGGDEDFAPGIMVRRPGGGARRVPGFSARLTARSQQHSGKAAMASPAAAGGAQRLAVAAKPGEPRARQATLLQLWGPAKP
eukprot:58711-Chlamydomonas_euryale.AAC.1